MSLFRALTNIKRSPYQSIIALFMIAMTSFSAYSLTTFLYGADKLIQHFEQAPQVIAFFELDTDPSVIKNTHQNIQQKPYVKNTNLITQEQALELYRTHSNNNPLLLELVTADFLPASIEVSGNNVADLKLIAQELIDSDGIEEVQFQSEVVDQLERWIKSLRFTGLVFLGILASVSFLIISIIMALKASAKRHSIQIMRTIGATKWYIASPYMSEGAVYGLLGSLIGFGILQVGLLYLTPELKTFLSDIPIFPIAVEYFVIQASIITIASMIWGMIAARLAVGRMIKN